MSKKTSKPGTKAEPSIRSPASSVTGRLNVLLERVEEQQRVVIEAVTSNREALDRRIDALDSKWSARFEVIEFVVRKNSDDIHKNSDDIRTVSETLRTVSENLRAVEETLRTVSDKLDGKADAGRVAALEERVEVLEGRQPQT